MWDFQSHQLNTRHTFGILADTPENEIANHLSQFVLIMALLAGYLEVLWFKLSMIQSSFWIPLT